jgi:hypothetical protein
MVGINVIVAVTLGKRVADGSTVLDGRISTMAVTGCAVIASVFGAQALNINKDKVINKIKLRILKNYYGCDSPMQVSTL